MNLFRYRARDLIERVPYCDVARRLVQAKRSIVTTPNTGRTHRNYLLLHNDPVVLISPESLCDLQLFAERMETGKPAVFVKLLWWSHESVFAVRTLVRHFVDFSKRFPAVKVLIACNTEIEMRMLAKEGLPCVFANQNALLDGKKYILQEAASSEFDVIYNGRILPYKRHYLLEDVPSERIALISAPLLGSKREEYLAEICRLIPEARILNWDPPRRFSSLGQWEKVPQLDHAGVSFGIGRAVAGTVLSSEEGACYASAEYLLCGRPVLSTENVGGRDVFLTADVSLTVKPTSNAVARGLESILRRNWNPSAIRESTLDRMKPHRERFYDAVQSEVTSIGSSLDIRRDCGHRFVDKMVVGAIPFPVEFDRSIRDWGR